MAKTYTGREQVNAIPLRETHYNSCNAGVRFAATPQTPGAGTVTGQTGFVATTPTFLLDLPASQSRILLPSKIKLFQAGTVAGGPIEIAIAIDTVVRYASGGTAITPKNTNIGSTVAAVGTFYTNPTAAAATAVRLVDGAVVAASVGDGIQFNLDHGLLLPNAGGSLLIYTFAATTGPTWKYMIEWDEEVTA